MSPHAIRSLCPITTPGIPEKPKPATSNGQSLPTTRQCRPTWYHSEGIWGARCGSLASIGLPVVVWEPATTQEFEPMPAVAPSPAPAPAPSGEGAAARNARAARSAWVVPAGRSAGGAEPVAGAAAPVGTPTARPGIRADPAPGAGAAPPAPSAALSGVGTWVTIGGCRSKGYAG